MVECEVCSHCANCAENVNHTFVRFEVGFVGSPAVHIFALYSPILFR